MARDKLIWHGPKVVKRMQKAQRIGVIPELPLEKVRAVGNTALQGAKMYLLSTEVRAELSAPGVPIGSARPSL